MGNLYQHTHTYANIQREGCFCINFLPMSAYDRLVRTIHHNAYEEDEFAAGNFTLSKARSVYAPVIEGSVHQHGMYAEGRAGFERRGDYGYGHRAGAAHLGG